MRRLGELCLLLSICLILFFQDLDATDLWSAHEARAAQNAQRMLDDGSWELPQLYDGQVDLQKPPAFYWLVAGVAAARDGVVDRWSTRLPAAISGLLTVVMVYWFLCRRGRPVAGLAAAIILASTIHFTSAARTGRIDMPLACATSAAMFLLDARRYRLLCTLLAGIALASAIMLKGPIGVALPIVAMSAWFAWQRIGGLGKIRWTWLSALAAAAIGSLLALPWFLLANERTDGEFFRVFFWHHNVERALGDSPTLATHPWWYYGPRFAIDFLPWTPLLLAAVVCFARRRAWRTDGEAAFGLIWLVAMIGVLSLARFKRADYLLPAFTGAAIVAGCAVERWCEQLGVRGRRLVIATFASIVTATFGGWFWFHNWVEPRQEAVREQSVFAAHVRDHAPAPKAVLLFRVEAHLLAYHLRRPINTLVEWGELNERLARPGVHWFVTRAEFVDECRQNIVARGIEVVARSGDFSRAAPLRPLVLMRTVD